MTLLEWLQAGDSSFAILGGLLAAPFFLWRARSKAVASRYAELAHFWTNEGSVGSEEAMFVHLNLKFERGALFGVLRSSALKEELDVNVEPGWLWSKAKVTLLQGRSVFTVAELRLKLRGNNNQLEWKAVKLRTPKVLPTRVTLWPAPIRYESIWPAETPTRGA